MGVGALSDHYDRNFVVASCLFLGIIGLISFLIGPSLLNIITAVLLFGIGTSFFAALEPKMLDSLSANERNAGFGVFRTAYVVGGSSGSLGVGGLADLFGWRIRF